jgi:hypothetical protein
MNKLNLLIEDTGEEAWLFADLFASLLMTIVLLVNAHTATTSPETADDSGAAPPKTRLVYLVDAKTAKLDNDSTQAMPLQTLISILKSEGAHAEVVGTMLNNGVVLFEVFHEFEEHKLEYRYAINL